MELPSDNCSATYNRDSQTLELKGNKDSYEHPDPNLNPKIDLTPHPRDPDP